MLQSCIGQVAKTIGFVPVMTYDTRMFNSRDGFVFCCLAPELQGQPRLEYFVGENFGRTSIACGGTYTHPRGRVYEREHQIAFGFEVNLQMIIDAILALTDPGNTEEEIVIKFKKQWQDHFLVPTSQQLISGAHLTKKAKEVRPPAVRRESTDEKEDTQKHRHKSRKKKIKTQNNEVFQQRKKAGSREESTIDNRGASNGETSREDKKGESRQQFVLLPPQTPLATHVWLAEVLKVTTKTESEEGNLMSVYSSIRHEQARMATDWKVALETAFAPPYLRRFFPSGSKSGCTVLIAAQSASHMAIAYQTRLHLCRLHLKSSVSPLPIPALANARKKMKLDETCDWLLYITTRNKHSPKQETGVQQSQTLSFRLYPCKVEGYITHYPQAQMAIADGDKWFASSSEVLTFLIQFYLELLGAMSPSAGHLMGYLRCT
eukprot:Blabericola_migrator_1__12657@NODE_808_length_6437_cov_165_443956_g411_i1_p2_GENE_NODE_808_length_6437_cov_165_443956_g411_i1NODE_808_length_6437_cov_165_443956_g411_i1_p2_ORF_typecomplete_len433_score61_70Factin_cap_A/PF01267_17/0_0019DUF2335/PF10097_9/3DUF2335/PF10097_9/1_8e04_NODE_808_length_6437_cov_165_443956_g411_i138295127